jgi:hypothetical protein
MKMLIFGVKVCNDVDYNVLISMVKPLRDKGSATSNTIEDAVSEETDDDYYHKVTSPRTKADFMKNLDIQLCAQTFFDMLYSDVQTARNFYNQSISEDEALLKSLENRARDESWTTRRIGVNKAKKSLQMEMIALYRKLEFLYSFLHVNRLAISNLLRKFAELIPENAVQHILPQETTLYTVLYDEFCSPRLFCDSSLVKELMEQTENLYATVFCANDHQKAVNSLREPHDKHSHSDTFKLAFNIGIVVPVIFMTIVLWIRNPPTSAVNGFYGVLPVFRGTLLYIIYIWLWGFNLYVFHQKRINHIFIFEFNPNNSLNHIKIFKTASVLTVIWVFYFFLYLGAAEGTIDLIPINSKYYPLALALTLIIIVILPFHMFHLSSRLTLLKIIGNLLITPFGRADFRECFVADILTSMVIPITDTMYMFCYFFSNTWFYFPYDNHNKCHDINRFAGPCLTFLPYGWRLGQCLKKYYETRMTSHLINGLKYLSAITVILLNALHTNLEEESNWGPIRWIWLIAVVISTLFSYSWDIEMDWGLLKFGRGPKSTIHISAKVENPSLNAEETERLFSSTTYGTSDSSTLFQPSSSTQQAPDSRVKKQVPKSNKRKISWKNTFKPRLRDRRFFTNYVYYLMIIFNFIARFAWAGTISTFFEERKDFLKVLFGSIELVRRCLWSLLRLEWAVISNSEGYRKHATVPLPMNK